MTLSKTEVSRSVHFIRAFLAPACILLAFLAIPGLAPAQTKAGKTPLPAGTSPDAPARPTQAPSTLPGLQPVPGGVAGQTAAFGQVELPVTRVVLYSSGVAYVEHRGKVEGNARTRLGFTPDQIKDVLKSMILMDQGGGRIEAVNYTSQDPVSRALKSFTIDLSEKPGLAQILDQMRGAEVRILTPEVLTGRILGVEWQNLTNPVTREVQSQAIVNLLSPDGIRAIPLSGISSIRPLDEGLARELQKALELILGASDSQRKMVDISFAGPGLRPVVIGYIVEAPVWKTSWRLDLSAQYLQGWAIVENVGDQDWNQVTLSLASGSPVSFIQDLYTPLYNPRPVIGPALQENLAPTTYESGVSDAPGAPAPAPAMASSGATMNRLALSKGMAEDMEYKKESLEDSGVAPGATAGKLGELFFFTVNNLVSMPRRSGAMIPLVGQTIKAERLSVYSAGTLESHPMNGARITNTTETRLPGGPITVFDGGAYGGDALVDSIGPGENRYLTYAVDLDIQADPSSRSTQDIQRFSLSRGVLYIQRLTTHFQNYRFTNRSKSDRTVVVEHPKDSGRKLVEPAKADEETEAVLRFRTNIKAGETKDFAVREESVSTESVSLVSSGSRSFLSWTSNKIMGPKVRQALEQAAALKATVEITQAGINDRNNQKSGLARDQERLRANIETLGRESVQGKRYLEKLLESENRIDVLEQEIQKLQADLAKAQTAFDDFLRTMSAE